VGVAGFSWLDEFTVIFFSSFTIALVEAIAKWESQQAAKNGLEQIRSQT
jgi:hypothetical protein